MRDLYRDFSKDWRRWTKAERASAAVIMLGSIVSSAILLSSA